MSALVIPSAGLDIKGFSAKSNHSKQMAKAIGLTLSNGVIEDMIRCVRAGNMIQLSMDKKPSITYGNKTQRFDTIDDTSFEIVRSNAPNLVRTLSNSVAPHPGPRTFANAKITSNVVAMIGQNLVPISSPVVNSVLEAKSASSTKELESNVEDAALAALQNSLASESLRKAENTVKYVKDGSLPIPGKRGAAKSSKSLGSRAQSRPNNDFATKCLPLSPSLNSTSVPLSQQQAEHAKAARKPVIHFLAVSPLTEKALESKIPNTNKEDLKQALEKVGDLNESTGKWELRKSFYKELDVWCFKYKNPDDRQRAIDNAVKIFDKMRINVSEPQWEKLLPRHERGTGKCLSKLQAQIAQASNQKVPKNGDTGRDSPQKANKDDGPADKVSNKAKGESAVRTSSQGSTTKPKKVIKEREAQAKRLLSKKPASAKVPAIKATTVPKKGQSVIKDAKPTINPLSSEYVESSEEEVVSPVEKSSSKPQKRQRENDDASYVERVMSPAKKINREIPISKNRVSETSRVTNNSQYSFSSKSIKTNSPRKSSPLAASPPTNASDLEESSDVSSPNMPSSHSCLGIASRSPIKKSSKTKPTTVTEKVDTDRPMRRLGPELADLARRYKMYYPEYLRLHLELTSKKKPRDRAKEQALLDMHTRLVNMKKRILADLASDSIL